MTNVMATAPIFFSIIIPLYNRERQIVQCLNSVLSQDFSQFEVIVVDDGSTDGSVGAVLAYDDARVRLIRHPVNRGVCPARNTGVAEAKGAWVIFLDSDDELSSTSALGCIYAYAIAAAQDIGQLAFRCKLDDGRISPELIQEPKLFDAIGYLRFLEQTHGRVRDVMSAVRLECARVVRFPENRMLEDGYHLTFSRTYKQLYLPDVLRLYHQDADNQLTKYLGRVDPERDKALIRDRAEGLEALLKKNAAALRLYAPCVYRAYLYNATIQSLLAHRWRSALALALLHVRCAPLKGKAWGLWGGGAFGAFGLLSCVGVS